MDHDDGMEGHSDDPVSPVSPSSAKDNSRKRSTRGPSQKRGPPKGYLNALETRLHEAEALLGAIISSPQAETLVGTLSKDPLAEKIITRVNKSVFGALGREPAGQPENGPSRGRRRPDKARQRMSNSEILYSRDSGSPVFTSPSYAWQDHLSEQLAAKDPSPGDTASRSDSVSTRWEGDRRQKRRTDTRGGSLRVDIESATQQVLYPARTSANNDYLPEPESPDLSGCGQLSLGKDLQVKYLGESSGLTLLSQCPRSDVLYSQQIWRLPQTPVYRPMEDDGSMSFDHEERQVQLPSIPTQEHLLRQYFHYVHPILPIVNRDEFWDHWASLQKFGSGGPTKLLLLSMFALAAQYSDPDDIGQSNQDSPVGHNSYMADIHTLLKQTFVSSRLSTCQALLLLAYRAIGLSGLTDASLFLSKLMFYMFPLQHTDMSDSDGHPNGDLAALDLGLNRQADRWVRDGTSVFSQHVLRIRRSVWYGCVVLDTYIAAQLGRPLRIHREDYDARLPDVDTQEDFQLWMPYRNTPTVQGYTPLPSRITSCFRSLSTIAEIFALVLRRLYAVNSGWTTAQRHAEFSDLDMKLQRWYMEMPEILRSTASPVPPPQILCLHMLYWHTMGSCRALDLGAAAASNLTNLVQTYNSTFGLRHASGVLIYYILVACAMHTAVLQLHSEDVQAKIGLSIGMSCLEEIKETWPAASHAYALLSGVNIDTREPAVGRNDLSRKRPLDESHSVTSSQSHPQSQSEPGSVPPQSSHDGMNIFHPSQFMELTHSLGLDPSGLNSVFDVPACTTWPSNDPTFAGMQEDMGRNPTILLGHKGPG
ncbi:fungal-specific transcription factor domain-containing protein [Gautieria morchelliformis]|nr:fungal-specific transcription factor domain-containing protein [Gautieria morchelliformis]